nr:unnamed protein product [Digitaria exilis]
MSVDSSYDRTAELHALDATLAGVRGLLGGGDQQPPSATVPVIDLGGDRAAVVDAVGRAAAEWGFFQVTGHGVPEEAMASAMAAVQAFHEAESGESSDKARL